MAPAPEKVALIVGVTGLVGKELAQQLAARPEWKVYGLARKPNNLPLHGHHYQFISCDLLDPKETMERLSLLEDVTHIFWVTWASQFPLDTQECCDQNKAMMSNALNSILPRAKSLKHVSLQTGTKHYISLSYPFDTTNKVQHYDEETPRAIGGHNFYYTLEDLLKEKLPRSVGWSVHRPGLLLGSSRRTVYNFMGSLCVYGAICRYLNLPFVFWGARTCWQQVYMDASDARLVARQQIWVSSSTNEGLSSSYGGLSSSNGHAFNAINGPAFTWKEIWPAIGAKFGVEVPEDMFSSKSMYSTSMCDMGKVWEEIVEREGLQKTKMEDLANWCFLDMVFRCPMKILATRDKVDQLGFTTRYRALDSIMYWVDCMRDDKLIP
ncbi:hypothetical protein AAC387_Pa01g0536 [Persea americana]